MDAVRILQVVQGVLGLALVVLGLALGLVSGACTRKLAARLKVAVTVFPIYDLTRAVAGPDADVVLLIPPEVSLHDLNAAPPRADAVSGARLGIMVGLGLDDWMKTLLDQAAPTAHRLIVGDRVPTIPGLEGKPDPHVWLDPERAVLMSKAIAEEMARVDPTHAAGFRSRSFALQQGLDALDREVEGRVATWTSRSFVSSHAAFAYYADRYHLEVATCPEPTEGVTPPPRYVVLDPLGGRGETDTYDKLIRFDTNALEKVMKSPPAPSLEEAGPPLPFTRPADSPPDGPLNGSTPP